MTVAADRFLHNTTSSGAAGLWEPYKLGRVLHFWVHGGFFNCYLFTFEELWSSGCLRSYRLNKFTLIGC